MLGNAKWWLVGTSVFTLEKVPSIPPTEAPSRCLAVNYGDFLTSYGDSFSFPGHTLQSSARPWMLKYFFKSYFILFEPKEIFLQQNKLIRFGQCRSALN